MNPEEEFSRKLTETDAYLQLIINQLKDLDEKIEDAAKNEHAVEEIRRLAEIKVETLTLLDRVKHTIVLLQIAKNTLNGSLSVQPGLTQQPAGGSSTATTASSSLAERKKKSVASQPAQKQQLQESQFHSNKVNTGELQGSSLQNKSTSTVHSTAPHDKSVPNASNCISQVNQTTGESARSSAGLGEDTACQGQQKNLPTAKSNSIDRDPAFESSVKQSDESAFGGEDAPLAQVVVPETSYSSSDDGDDEYYDVRSDADDDFVIAPDASSNARHSAMPRRRSLHSTSSHSSVNQGKPVTPSASAVREEGDTSSSADSCHSPGELPQSHDYDALYDDDEEELGPLDGHGSVISHLISQVKIGMDLTKVVLPTFILERRSLLEMYADFFAHPDIFVAIADGRTPEDRFIAVVRWYLSAFHAGRKSSVAKKPYNPVLGEVFKCSWDIPGYVHADVTCNHKNGTSSCSSSSPSSLSAPSTQSPTDPSLQVTQSTSAQDNNAKSSQHSLHGDSPVSCPANLTFIAEQVSHHPPVSAFYAEHAAKRIQCTGHIYTKSAFLGLSIGVHNIGRGSIYLLNYGEEYTVTFPSAYGRSILSVPWIELGGSVTISCQQTNYSANVTFQTKPFYGGKKHKILCEVSSPSKKNFLTIAGEWNGTMKAKWSSNGHEEVFVDTKTIPIVKKKVAPINTQQEYESRRLWKDLTLALKIGDTDLATATKSKIEQRQRDAVKERQQTGIGWKTREFHKLNSDWFYNNPLAK